MSSSSTRQKCSSNLRVQAVHERDCDEEQICQMKAQARRSRSAVTVHPRMSSARAQLRRRTDRSCVKRAVQLTAISEKVCAMRSASSSPDRSKASELAGREGAPSSPERSKASESAGWKRCVQGEGNSDAVEGSWTYTGRGSPMP